MGNTTNGFLIAAVCLIVVGAALFCGAMAALGWNWDKLSTKKVNVTTHEVTDPFLSVSVDTDTADVIFLPGESCSVVCKEYENMSHTVEVKDGVLTIRGKDSRKWYEHIGFFFSKTSVTVTLPTERYDALKVRTNTGSIHVPADFSFDTAKLETDTGNITCNATVTLEAGIKTDTGNIYVENLATCQLELTTSTGNITANLITCTGDITATVNTGNVAFANVTCQNIAATANTGNLKFSDISCRDLTATANTGDVTLKNVVADVAFRLETDTGDVKFENSDAAEIYVNTDTGDVTGTLLTDKVFLVESDTGHVDVPKTVTGGRCEIETDTGDIKIKIS